MKIASAERRRSCLPSGNRQDHPKVTFPPDSSGSLTVHSRMGVVSEYIRDACQGRAELIRDPASSRLRVLRFNCQ